MPHLRDWTAILRAIGRRVETNSYGSGGRRLVGHHRRRLWRGTHRPASAAGHKFVSRSLQTRSAMGRGTPRSHRCANNSSWRSYLASEFPCSTDGSRLPVAPNTRIAPPAISSSPCGKGFVNPILHSRRRRLIPTRAPFGIPRSDSPKSEHAYRLEFADVLALVRQAGPIGLYRDGRASRVRFNSRLAWRNHSLTSAITVSPSKSVMLPFDPVQDFRTTGSTTARSFCTSGPSTKI